MRFAAPLLCAAVGLTGATHQTRADDTTVAGLLERAAKETSALYDGCTVSIAFANSTWSAEAVTGFTALNGTVPTTTDDPFVWGSLTKMLTGTQILRQVSAGNVTLDSPIGPIINAAFKHIRAASPPDAKWMNYTTVEDLWGEAAGKLSIRQLGKMMSGIPDFDTAKGSGKLSTDELRKTMYAEPDHFYGPLEILSLPWVYTDKLQPVGGHSYSSTNFMLLGLALAELAGAPSWENYTQLHGFPEAFRASRIPNVSFAVSGAPQDHSPVHGYDLTSYNGHNEDDPLDISGVDGVFSGWTASDLVGPPRDVAQLIYGIYGPDSPLLTPDLQEFMVPKANESFYGFATFNLTHRTGVKLPEGAAYGHLGATYGYQSIGAFFPAPGFALAIATNLETNHQAQPATAMCKAFNMVRALQAGQPIPTCTYESGGYYSSGCECKVAAE